MSVLIHEHSAITTGPDGARYRARVQGDERSDGTWAGWIEFVPIGGKGTPCRTGQETSQPNKVTLDYWAGGIEPLFLEGALERALRRAGSTT
jgi:hypothetical protein